MGKLHQRLFELIDKLQIAEAFALLDKHTGDSPEKTTLKQEYKLGKYGADYYERFKMFVLEAIDKDAVCQDKQTIFLAPFSPNDFFLGREQNLQELWQALSAGKRTLLVSGLGGIGKTSLARQYVHQYQAEYQHIVWLQQSGQLSSAFLQANLLGNLNIAPLSHGELSESLQITPLPHEKPQDVFEKVLASLAKLQGTNLLILDNYETTGHAQIAEETACVFALPPHWHILLTSREEVRQAAQTFTLDVLPPHLAIDLFIEHAKPKPCDRLEVKELLARVGFHTLMAELWAKTYSEDMLCKDVRSFAALLQTKGVAHERLQQEIRAKGEEKALYAHISQTYSLAKLEKDEIYLLKQWVVLPTMPHAGEDFLKWIQDDALAYLKPLKKLAKLGWLQTKDKINYYLHPALQLVLRAELKPAYEDCKELCGYFEEMADFENIMANPLAYEGLIPFFEALIERVSWEREQESKAYLLKRLRNVHNGLGNYADALLYAQEVVEIQKEIQGTKRIGYLYALNWLANVRCNMKQYQDALPLYQELVRIGKETLGEDDEDYLMFLHNLANVYKDLNKFKEALLLYQEVVNKQKKILGEENQKYLFYLNNLANTYTDMGKYDKALPLLQEVLKTRKKVLGEEHPNYAFSLHNMGRWHYNQNKLKESLPYFNKAHAIQSKKLGEQHPRTKKTKEMLDKASKHLAEQ